jgi:hypothetical protein
MFKLLVWQIYNNLKQYTTTRLAAMQASPRRQAHAGKPCSCIAN